VNGVFPSLKEKKDPKRIGDVIFHLASEQARDITGTVISFDSRVSGKKDSKL
jgi:hypothetical protein